jgi:sporulation protein YlmC with PRC-barrel domain
MTPAGRVLHAGLQVLDRQLVDRTGRLCGKVDDLVLSEPDERGAVHVTAILCGPGALLERTGHTRLGGWLRRVLATVFDGEGELLEVPFSRVADIGDHVTLALDGEQLPTFATERWVREHVVGHIPGSRVDAPG